MESELKKKKLHLTTLFRSKHKLLISEEYTIYFSQVDVITYVYYSLYKQLSSIIQVRIRVYFRGDGTSLMNGLGQAIVIYKT